MFLEFHTFSTLVIETTFDVHDLYDDPAICQAELEYVGFRVERS